MQGLILTPVCLAAALNISSSSPGCLAYCMLIWVVFPFELGLFLCLFLLAQEWEPETEGHVTCDPATVQLALFTASSCGRVEVFLVPLLLT